MMTMKSPKIVALALLLAACSTSPSEPNAAATAGATATATATDASMRAGYAHSLGSSRFAIGVVSEDATADGVRRIVGQHGVVMTDLLNGSYVAVPNANAPSREVPSSTTADAHNARARAYFLAAGIPADQIADVHVTTMMRGGGSAAEGTHGGEGRPEVVAYYSIATRAIDGVAIVDSTAWVRLNAKDEVVAEAVYWPAIPKGVIEQAKAMRDRISRPDDARFLPLSESESPRAVVRHSTATEHRVPAALATYDVIARAGAGRTIVKHFDPRGAVLRLPSEEQGDAQKTK